MIIGSIPLRMVTHNSTDKIVEQSIKSDGNHRIIGLNLIVAKMSNLRISANNKCAVSVKEFESEWKNKDRALRKEIKKIMNEEKSLAKQYQVLKGDEARYVKKIGSEKEGWSSAKTERNNAKLKEVSKGLEEKTARLKSLAQDKDKILADKKALKKEWIGIREFNYFGNKKESGHKGFLNLVGDSRLKTPKIATGLGHIKELVIREQKYTDAISKLTLTSDSETSLPSALSSSSRHESLLESSGNIIMEGGDEVSLAGSPGEANQYTVTPNPIKHTEPPLVQGAEEQSVLHDNEGALPPLPPPMPDVKQSVLHDNSLGNTKSVLPPVTNDVDKDARAELLEQIRTYSQSKKAAGKDKTVSAGGGELKLDQSAKRPETVQEMLLSSPQFTSLASQREADNTENTNAEGMGADDDDWED